MSLSLREFRPRCDEVSRYARLLNTPLCGDSSIFHSQFLISFAQAAAS